MNLFKFLFKSKSKDDTEPCKKPKIERNKHKIVHGIKLPEQSFPQYETNRNTEPSGFGFTIDPIIHEPLENNLLPGEIILLNWLDGKTSDKVIPTYFYTTYELIASEVIQKFIEQGYIIQGSDLKRLQSLTINELKIILKKHDLPVTGKKSVLIGRLEPLLKNINFDKIEDVYELTESAKKECEKYSYILKAHQDTYFDVGEAIKIKKKYPHLFLYGDMKWLYLNNQHMEYISSKKYGLLRNVELAKSDQLLKEKKYVDSLTYLINVQLLDCSGMSNACNSCPYPIYDEIIVAPGIEKIFKKLELLTSNEEYDIAFDRSSKSFLNLPDTGFITTNDLLMIRKYLRPFDNNALTKYFKKYEKYTYEYQTKRT